MLRLIKGRDRLIAPGKTYLKGEEYKKSDINPKLFGYFESTSTVIAEEAEPKIIEKIVPSFGNFSLEQLKGLEKGALQILILQYNLEIKGRPSNDELAELIFDAQPEPEEDGEE